MGLPEKGTTDQLSVIIKRKLTEMTGDTHNVQVCLDEKGGTVMLRDGDGVFVTAEHDVTMETGSGVGGMSDGSVHGVGTGIGSGVGGGARCPNSDSDNRGATSQSSQPEPALDKKYKFPLLYILLEKYGNTVDELSPYFLFPTALCLWQCKTLSLQA